MGAPVGPFAMPFVKCFKRHSTNIAFLPSVTATTLGKEALPVPRCAFFAECYGHALDKVPLCECYTRQNDQNILFICFYYSIQTNKQKIYHRIITYIIHTIYLTKITNLTNITTSNKFTHKHKSPTLTNISLKYLTKYYNINKFRPSYLTKY
jgi:hypothetical protein